MRIIYADSMFLLNFAADYLLLLAAGKICLLPLTRWRMALGAVWGGVYAVLSALYPGFFALGTVKIISGVLCAAIAFGGCGPFARTALVYFAVSAAFGGAIYAAIGLGGAAVTEGPVLGISTRTLVLSFALCYALLSAVFRGVGRRGTREIAVVSLSLRGRQVSFSALRDTGCELCDGRNRPVMAVRWDAAAELFPEISHPPRDAAELCLALSGLEGMAGRCRVLSCTTAVGSGGLLAAFRPDEISIKGEKSPHALAAITFAPLSPDGEYQALF